MDFGFEIVGAKPKGQQTEPATSQAMRVGDKIRRNPSTDQKSVRRQLQRGVTKKAGLGPLVALVRIAVRDGRGDWHSNDDQVVAQFEVLAGNRLGVDVSHPEGMATQVFPVHSIEAAAQWVAGFDTEVVRLEPQVAESILVNARAAVVSGRTAALKMATDYDDYGSMGGPDYSQTNDDYEEFDVHAVCPNDGTVIDTTIRGDDQEIHCPQCGARIGGSDVTVTSKMAGAKSDTCPKCGSHMDDVQIFGDVLHAHCDVCGWDGSKRRSSASKTAGDATVVRTRQDINGQIRDALDRLGIGAEFKNSSDGRMLWYLDTGQVLTPGEAADHFLPGGFAGNFGRSGSKKVAWSIDQVRKVVDTQTYSTVDGMTLDLFSASALTQIYDALSPENQAKLQGVSLDKAVSIAFQLAKGKGASKIAMSGSPDNPYGVIGWGGHSFTPIDSVYNAGAWAGWEAGRKGIPLVSQIGYSHSNPQYDLGYQAGYAQAKTGSMKTGSATAPDNGDVVVVAEGGDYYAAKPGDRAVVQLGLYGPGTIGICFRASAFRPDDGAYVSCSGGPLPEVKIEDLKYAGKTQQRFWKWNQYGAGAGNGVDYTLEVDMWEWMPPNRMGSTSSKTGGTNTADPSYNDDSGEIPCPRCTGVATFLWGGHQWYCPTCGWTGSPSTAKTSSKTASPAANALLQDAVIRYSRGEIELKAGDRFGDSTITDVGDQTVQYIDDDGWSGAMQLLFNDNGVMTPAWQRAYGDL